MHAHALAPGQAFARLRSSGVNLAAPASGYADAGKSLGRCSLSWPKECLYVPTMAPFTSIAGSLHEGVKLNGALWLLRLRWSMPRWYIQRACHGTMPPTLCKRLAL